VVTPAQLRYNDEPTNGSGLRNRKKLQTRQTIQDAALELFVAQGYETTTVEQIAARAEVSPTTFFRYFGSKSEVIKGDQGERLPALQEAILKRPRGEDDLEVLRVAIQQEWISSVDPERTLRQASVIAISPELRGVSFEVGFQWRAAISESLAQRHGLDAPDDRCVFAVSTVMSVFWRAVEIWRRGGATGELSDYFDEGFELMIGLCAEWAADHRSDTDRPGRSGRRSRPFLRAT
jgi:AcrR family transcriptional regulator